MEGLTEAFGGLRESLRLSLEGIMPMSQQLAQQTAEFDKLTAKSLEYKDLRNEINAFEKEGAALSQSLVQTLMQRGAAEDAAITAAAAGAEVDKHR